MTSIEFSNFLNKFAAKSSVLQIRNNTFRPSYDKMYIMYEKHNVPFTIWKDVKAFIKNDLNNM